MPASSKTKAKDSSAHLGVVESERFVESHGGHLGDISSYGQDKSAGRKRRFGRPQGVQTANTRKRARQSNATTRRLAFMNFVLRGIEADLGPEHADTFRRDLHPDLRADYVPANPPFNDSGTAPRNSAFVQREAKRQVVSEAKDNFRKDDDVRWQFGLPPKGSANFAWVQHFTHHLAPHGLAGFANGSMSSNQSGKGDIRRALMEDDLVDGMVALPGQLFYSTQIPVCLWFLTKSKAVRVIEHGCRHDLAGCIRERRKETLFIDARKLGTLIDRILRELTDDDLAKIARTCRLRKRDSRQLIKKGKKRGIAVKIAPALHGRGRHLQIRHHRRNRRPRLRPYARPYVGAEEVEDDGDPFKEKMPRLVAGAARRVRGVGVCNPRSIHAPTI